MELFDRFYALHHELDRAKQPIPMRTLCQRLECSRSTIKRVIEKMTLYYNAPIHYDRKRNGYSYQQIGSERFEMPGIWFTPDEILALLTFQALLSDLQPGLLNPLLQPLNKRIDKILDIKREPAAPAPQTTRPASSA
jgi:predicted DNA-binding transcriptional regulator YafY